MKYVAEISHVREVCLRGEADWDYWQERLRGDRLFPVKRDGKAQLLVSAIDASFWGVRFQELCIAVLICEKESSSRLHGYYFLQGFHSSRLFALVERQRFSTPYLREQISVVPGPPACMQLTGRDELLFQARMSADSATQATGHGQEDAWEGPIYLPANKLSPNTPRKFFMARFRGQSQSYPFRSSDILMLRRNSHSVFTWLLESGFAGTQWSIRPDATHARSKTMRRKTPA